MAQLSIGYAALLMEAPASGGAPSWGDVQQWAQMAEAASFDTFWVADELVWEDQKAGTAAGWWEGVALAAAVAAVTERIGIGSWVLSALHRNPGLIVKSAEAIDEISGGRFVLGLGAGHAGRQGEMFGFPPDRTVSRYEEALEVIVPLVRDGVADFEGEYHRAVRQPNRPRGPQGSAMPLMLGGHGPRTIGLAVRHADIWSAFATSSSQPEAFAEMLELVDRTCDEQGRDPASLGRSIGIGVVPPGEEPTGFWPDPVSGSAEQIAETLSEFETMGVTSIELCIDGDQARGLELLPGVLDLVKKG